MVQDLAPQANQYMIELAFNFSKIQSGVLEREPRHSYLSVV